MSTDDELVPAKIHQEGGDHAIQIGEARDVSIIQIDQAEVQINQGDEKSSRRIDIKLRWVLVLLVALVVGIVAILIFYSVALRPETPETMSGDFRIAVAGFAEIGSSPVDNLGYELADGLRLRLEKDLEAINPGLLITTWGPDQAGYIQADTPEGRASLAERLARQINADLVIYGAVDTSQETWQVVPEFYVSAENFYEAQEIIGQYDMGEPFSLPGQSNSAWRYEFGKSMLARSKALAHISVGLAYISLHDYETALSTLQAAESIENWPDAQGKKVLYVLLGLAAGKTQAYDQAETALQRALVIDPEYARPLIGLANVSYMRAIQVFDVSKNPQDIQAELLTACFTYLDQATQSTNKPPLADVEAKVHFSRGQCAFAQAYANASNGQSTDMKPAIQEFELVIQAYGDGVNPRLRELTGEAHARLGMIYNLLKNDAKAISEYQLAAELLAHVPERQQLYLKRADQLRQKTSVP